jgi:ABC-type sulfate transport system permease component
MKKLLLATMIVLLLIIVTVPVVALAADDGIEDAADFWSYIQPEVYILIPALYLVGLFIKKIPGAPDWIIPFILLALGLVGAIVIIGFTIYGIIQGVFVAGVTVFANQAWKQIMKARDGTG